MVPGKLSDSLELEPFPLSEPKHDILFSRGFFYTHQKAMETYIEARDFVADTGFTKRREYNLKTLKQTRIDPPLVNLIRDFSRLSYCYTQQCCYGHFVYPSQSDPDYIGPLSSTEDGGQIEYRIAYLALCVENNDNGKRLIGELGKIPELDPMMIQFGSATWFWEQAPNSFILQVEPDRFKDRDTAAIGCEEALQIEKVKKRFFDVLNQTMTSFKP
jgi:hypothetical protein